MKKLMRSTVAAGACALVFGAVAPSATAAEPEIKGYSPDVQAEAVSALSAERGLTQTEAENMLRAQEGSVRALDNALAALGEGAVNGYLDATGTPVVNVVNEAAAATVGSTEVTTKVVGHTAAELDAAHAELASLASIADTSIAIDPATNQVVLTVAEQADDAAAADLLAAAEGLGEVVRVEHVPGSFEAAIYGGEAITGGGSRCSAGFNVNSGGQNYIVDAGHCTAGVLDWNVGPSVDASFPGDDYGLIRNDTGSAPGAVSLYDGTTQQISSAADAYVGQSICKSGSTTGLTCGTVQATNVTVNYAEGAVHQLVQTSASVNSGDSGGSLFSGSVGLGITSGMGGGSSFFQPLTEALSAYGMSLN